MTSHRQHEHSVPDRCQCRADLEKRMSLCVFQWTLFSVLSLWADRKFHQVIIKWAVWLLLWSCADAASAGGVSLVYLSADMKKLFVRFSRSRTDTWRVFQGLLTLTPAFTSDFWLFVFFCVTDSYKHQKLWGFIPSVRENCRQMDRLCGLMQLEVKLISSERTLYYWTTGCRDTPY